ncbi:hypothetical protein Tco_1219511 [Tanacetum coccineum]
MVEAELKQLMKIIPDEEEVAIDSIPLAIKPQTIINCKIHKEGKNSYFHIIIADGSSKMNRIFSQMLKSVDRQDLEDLYKLVKDKYGSTRPVEDMDLLLLGYVFILNGGAVDWKSSKQSTTAMSATEAEYLATSEAAMESVWIRKFISRLGIVPTINKPIKMFCDNSAVLLIANKPGVQMGARHYHRSNLLKVHTGDNLAYLLQRLYRKESLLNMLRAWDFV